MSLRSRPVPPRQDAALVVQLQEEVITRVVFGETGARGIFKLDGGGGVGILRLRRRGHEGALGGERRVQEGRVVGALRGRRQAAAVGGARAVRVQHVAGVRAPAGILAFAVASKRDVHGRRRPHPGQILSRRGRLTRETLQLENEHGDTVRIREMKVEEKGFEEGFEEEGLMRLPRL
jgi:hypothetical protein